MRSFNALFIEYLLLRPFRAPLFYYFLFFLFLAMIPPLGTSDSVLDIFFLVFLYAYLSLAWNIQAGFCGQYSVGQAAYFGIAAYTIAILYTRTGISPWLGLLIGVGIAFMLSVAIGLPIFRLEPHYYILATLAIAEILRMFFLVWDFAGASNGIWYPIVPDSLSHFQFHESRFPYYYIALGLMIMCIFIARVIRKSQLGLYLLTIRDDEVAAQSVGINTFKYKVIASAISASLIAAGGAVYTQFALFVDPFNTFSIVVSLDILLPSLIGGIGTVIGPILGSFLLTPTKWIFRTFFGSEVFHVVFNGAFLMLVIAIMPKGLVGALIDKFVRPRLIRK